MEPLSIIVVDDVPEIRDVMVNFLTPLGHHVVAAANGHQAAKLIRTQPCDLLITDVLMPDGDGLELIGELKRVDGTVRILAISGGGNTLQPDYCIGMAKAMGAHATLMKPFDRNQFFAGIEHALA
jgi:two-component system response regulator (stage 0 sporulation protein F)